MLIVKLTSTMKGTSTNSNSGCKYVGTYTSAENGQWRTE